MKSLEKLVGGVKKGLKSLAYAGLVGVALVGCGRYAEAKTFYVDDDKPANYNKIQAAIDAVSDQDEIIVREGIYIENINLKGKSIILRSTKPTELSVVKNTIIDGNKAGSVVTFSGGEDKNCILNGFTIRNGKARRGGGIYCGWIIESRGKKWSPTIMNNIITNNSAREGGGMYNMGMGSKDSGRMYNGWSNPTLTNCTFSGNKAEHDGGGMSNLRSSPTLTNCTFIGNSARNGGGISNLYESNPTLTNCTFSGNKAEHGGGGCRIIVAV